MIGHGLGAAGGLEAIACIKAITTGWLHPTINQDVLAKTLTRLTALLTIFYACGFLFLCVCRTWSLQLTLILFQMLRNNMKSMLVCVTCNEINITFELNILFYLYEH